MKTANRTTREPVRKEMIDESRASFLLGLPKEQLREISEMSGLGHFEQRAPEEQGAAVVRMVFTYEELYRLCCLIVGPTS